MQNSSLAADFAKDRAFINSFLGHTNFGVGGGGGPGGRGEDMAAGAASTVLRGNWLKDFCGDTEELYRGTAKSGNDNQIWPNLTKSDIAS